MQCHIEVLNKIKSEYAAECSDCGNCGDCDDKNICFDFSAIQALNLATQALEQEPCEDAVSRKALLDKAYAYGNGLEPEGYCVDVEDVQALPPVVPTVKISEDCIDRYSALAELNPLSYEYKAIKELPSVVPKRGKWILDEEVSKKHIEPIYICSACKNYEAWGNTEKTPFCPNCGARMESEE